MPADNESLVDLDEIVSLLQQYEGPPQARERERGDARRRVSVRPRMLRLRWGLVGAATALLVGSGLGFGVASSVTPSGTAGTPFAGFGFLPVRGWTVVQSGTLGPTGAASAIAATVPLHPGDRLGAVPVRTLESMGLNGVVIRATFTTRGDPGEDFKFQQRQLPLRMADATPVPASDPALSDGLSEYRVAAGVRGHNVDARIYFGRGEPTTAMIANAERQLARLVVAAERVTIFARPTTVGWSPVGGPGTTLYGSIDSSRAGETVDIQAKDCGQQFFRGVAGATTRGGGEWTTEYTPGITTTLRAVWDGHSSAPVVVRSYAGVAIRRAGKSYEVGITARAQFWRRKVVIQQRRGSSWKKVREVLLTEQGSTTGWAYVYTLGTFKLPGLKKGTLIRAVLPAAAARPCYLQSVSAPFRV